MTLIGYLLSHSLSSVFLKSLLNTVFKPVSGSKMDSDCHFQVKEEMLFEALTTRKTVTVGEKLIVPYRLSEVILHLYLFRDGKTATINTYIQLYLAFAGLEFLVLGLIVYEKHFKFALLCAARASLPSQ